MNHLAELRANPYLREHDNGNGISSFNFSNKVFYHNLFQKQDCKIRGLFLYQEDGSIAIRAAQKFFEVNDSRFEENSLRYIRENASGGEYPMEISVKENGYLSLAGCDRRNMSLLTASKSSTGNWYANNFREIFLATIGDKVGEFIDYCHDNDCTFVFETIDPVNDAHIIRYHSRHVVLLDIIYNTWDFSYADYGELVRAANRFGFQCKRMTARVRNYDELEDFIFNHKGDMTVEGYVIRSAIGKMYKLHCQPYIYKKKTIRRIIGQLHSGKSPEEIKRYDEIDNKAIEQNLPAIVHNLEAIHGGDCPSFLEVWAEICGMI